MHPPRSAQCTAAGEKQKAEEANLKNHINVNPHFRIDVSANKMVTGTHFIILCVLIVAIAITAQAQVFTTQNSYAVSD
jgi:hypothetical protein